MNPVIQKPFGSIYQNWRLAKLPEYVFFQEGPGLRNWQWTNDGMKVINVKNILPDGSIDLSNSDRYISLEEFEKRYSHFAVEDRDIVVASSGNTYGKVGRIYRHHLPLMMNTSVIRFHPLSSTSLNPNYLFSFLRSDLFRNQVESFVIGSAQPNFGPSHLKMMEIPVPPLPTQRKIAAVLSAYDDLIENNTRRIEILEEMASAIYREWFVEFRFPGHEQVDMVESELGLIPQGWEVVKFSDIVDLSRKGIIPSKFPEEIFAHFSIPAFDNGRMPVYDSGNAIKSNKYLVTGDCILVSKLNPHIPRVWLPFLDTIHRAIASTEFLILKPKLPVDCVFLFNLCRSTEFSSKFAVRALGTSHSHQRVSPTDFLGLSILIPTESLLNSLHEKVSPMMNICNTLRLKNTNLRQTRDLLLPKLISGEIDLFELNIDTN